MLVLQYVYPKPRGKWQWRHLIRGAFWKLKNQESYFFITWIVRFYLYIWILVTQSFKRKIGRQTKFLRIDEDFSFFYFASAFLQMNRRLCTLHSHWCVKYPGKRSLHTGMFGIWSCHYGILLKVLAESGINQKAFITETVSRDGIGFWGHTSWLVLGLNRGRGQFLHFLGAPVIL